MATLEKAIALAVEKHTGQRDKYGRPYILHPLRVMMQQDNETDQIVAILHDVVEDSEVTLADLREMGFDEIIIAALDGVTRRDEETYEEFVDRTLQNPISCRIKLADLQDNMDVRRIPDDLAEKDIARLKRYQRAWFRISEQVKSQLPFS